jgi:hypothetical protein
MDMIKWEYFLVDAEGQPQLSHQLAALGREGWEAVGITFAARHYVVLLKRPQAAGEAIAPAAQELEVMLKVPDPPPPEF